MATIRQRGDASWEVQVRRMGWPSISRTFSSKADARSWAAVIESEMTRGVFIDRTEAERNTLGDLFRRYLKDVSAHKKGGKSEQYRLNALVRDPIAKFKVAGLSGRVMAEWRDRRLLAVSGSTTNRDLNLISHVINVARREWGIHVENPVAMIRRPSEGKPRKRRLSSAEEQHLLAALMVPPRDKLGRLTGPQNPWMLPLVITAIETAMRRGELLSLRWEHMELELGFVRLLDSKNGEARDVPLSSRAVSVLSQLPRHASGRVFPITADAVKKAFVRAAERSGIADLHFHDLRHEATSRLAERLSNVLELSSVTGHKTLSMLKRYYHPRAQDLAKKLG